MNALRCSLGLSGSEHDAACANIACVSVLAGAMEIDTTQIEIYLIEAGVILGGFLWLISWPFRGKLDHSKTLDKAAIALPIVWMVLGTLWINLRIAGLVSLPW